MNTIELNDEILKLELHILDREKIANDNRKSIALAKLTFKSGLANKLKEYSSDEKREAEADKEPGIKASLSYLQDYEYQNKVLKIELEHKLRLFKILTREVRV